MFRKHVSLILIMAMMLVDLSGCGSSTPTTTEAAVTTEAQTTAAPETTAPATTAQATTEAQTTAAPTTVEPTTAENRTTEFYWSIWGKYFQHGGDWTTWLTVQPDGSFTGEFTSRFYRDEKPCHEVGEFHGTFADPQQIDDLTWTVQVESLTVDGEIGEEWTEDGETYIRTGEPMGPVVGTTLTVYLPGSDSTTIPEEFFTWIRSSAEKMPLLEGTALVNDTVGINTYYYLQPEE